MKNLTNIFCVGALLFVMGCGCPQLRNLGKKDPPPPPPPPPSNSYPPPATPGKSGSGKLTMAQYNQLKIGMARGEVERLLGGSGEEISSSSGGGYTFSVNKWSGEDYTAIIISFKNDKIMSKSQVALK